MGSIENDFMFVLANLNWGNLPRMGSIFAELPDSEDPHPFIGDM